MSALRQLGVFVTLAGLAACAAPEPREDMTPPAGSRPACFTASQVSNFRALDRSSLIVYAPSKNNAYHVRISPPSIELRNANAIGFSSRNSRICGYAGESVRFDRNDRFSYSIVSVRRLDEVALQTLLESNGEGAIAPEPKDSDGAEIERDIDDDTES